MTTIVKSDDDSISFVNFQSQKSDPTLRVQAGDWDFDGAFSTGFTFLVTGSMTPLLSPDHARKLARWLQKQADYLDGVNSNANKKKKKKRFVEEDDEFDNYNFRG